MYNNNLYNKLTLTALIVVTTLISSNLLAEPTILEVKTKDIVVDGKKAQVYAIEQPDGTWGYYGYKNSMFDVIVKNTLDESTVVHWHGLTLPNNQDGVELTQQPIAPHSEYHYKFKLTQTGTYWMHSHFGLQEQKQLEAPLIIYDVKPTAPNQDIVLMLQDFSFKTPESIMQNILLNAQNTAPMKMNDNSAMSHNTKAPADLNDVKYDAYLINYKDLSNPQINLVKANRTVRLRFINGSSMSNFWINLGHLKGKLVSVDGNEVKPIISNKFQIGMGNRLDILVHIPQKLGYFSILAQVEGTKSQTGVILVNSENKKTSIPQISSQASTTAPALNYAQELQLSPLNNTSGINGGMGANTLENTNMQSHNSKSSYTKNTNESIQLVLDGNMKDYIWTINNQQWPNSTPIYVNLGSNITALITNNSMMAHPMHLHGYRFKIIAINGKKINGALQDTILVEPHSTVEVEFYADNPGKWFFHCHSLYHMYRGMMTYIQTKP
ncbi:MAG: hypothetical protein QG673_2320 [Pseudomonadota bacterium]|nr:hypothetical protein [Pseudomonadota bacterium]